MNAVSLYYIVLNLDTLPVMPGVETNVTENIPGLRVPSAGRAQNIQHTGSRPPVSRCRSEEVEFQPQLFCRLTYWHPVSDAAPGSRGSVLE